MEEPLSMARLAWIASELGSATRFPRKTIILQKPQPDEGLYSSCFSSMILSPLDSNVKMSPHETAVPSLPAAQAPEKRVRSRLEKTARLPPLFW